MIELDHLVAGYEELAITPALSGVIAAGSMTAIVGLLYIDSPLRLCNAYLQDDQIRLGQWLVGISSALGLAWLGTVTHEVMQREQQQQPPAR